MAPRPERRRAGLIAGVAIVAGLVALDVSWGERREIASTVVLAPFVSALLCSWRQTAFVAALAFSAILLSVLWNHDLGSVDHLLRVVVVAVGAAASVMAVRLRESTADLGAELASAEASFAVAVGSLGEALMIQRPGEGIVYANQAAADAMGLPTPEAVVAATPGEIASGWDTFNEDGSPLTPEQYPSRRILVDGETPPPLVVRTVRHATGEEFWRVIKAVGVHDDDGRLTMAVSVTEDITSVKRAELAQRLLAQAGEALSASLDVDDTLGRVARLLVPELSDWCSISLPDDEGFIRAVAVAHIDPDKVAFAREYGERWASRVGDGSASAEILRGGPSQLIVEIPDELLVASVAEPERLAALRSLGMRSVITVPVQAPAGAPLGVLSLVDAESLRVFTDADLALAEELGRRIGTAVQNVRLYEERAATAATLQAALLPDALPDVPGFALRSLYRPAGAAGSVGGDFYDAFAVDGGWMVIVGDVAGRGPEAATLTGQARHTLRAVAELTGSPARAVGHLNRLLVARAELSLCTVCAVRLDERDGGAVATLTCAGHPLPVLVRDGEPRTIGSWGPMVGAFDSEFSSVEVELREDDLLVLYTDGVLDARDGQEHFGERRLIEALAPATDADDALDRIVAALDLFQVGEQADDTAVLVVERRS